MKISLVTVLFICLFSVINAQAELSHVVPANSFAGRKVQLTDDTFNRYVVRQLRSVHTEYFFLIKKLHADAGELILLRERLMYLQKDFLRWKNECQDMNIFCMPQLSELYRQCKNLDQTILRIQEGKLKFTEVKNEGELDIRLQLYSSLTEMLQTNTQILHSLELTMMVSETPYFSLMPPQRDFSHLIYKMLLMSEMNMTSLLGSPLREEFHTIWTNYIKKIEFHILENEDKEYFLLRLEELNINWNNFHKNISKTHHKEVPSSLLSTVQIMHNRWNSLLRLVLR